jgi:hypothetical protein
MTLNFQLRREDLLAFTREYHAASPTFRRVRARMRYRLPVIMLVLWLISLWGHGFGWIRTSIYLGVAVAWFFFYPARFNRRIGSYSQKLVDEESHRKSLGPCELTLSEAGLHSKSVLGESTYYWSAVERVLLTDSHLFIFLNGRIGFPIPVADVGREAAVAALEYITSHQPETGARDGASSPQSQI